MFKSFRIFFESRIQDGAKEGAQGEQHRLRVATCALLLEAAHADNEFSDEERRKIGGLVARRFQLDPGEAAELLELAESERAASDDLYQFARLINEGFTHPRKLAIVELLWEVVYSDDVLESHEDALMHKLGKLLGVRHQELMALKVKVKDALG
ncbi:MAG: TerB family tellurite resistance protein [bacterium]